MSSALSNQSFVREGAGYEEVYPSGQKDPNTLSEERYPSATSPSSRDEGLEKDRPKGESSDNLDGDEPPIQSIIGPNGPKEFIMLPLWTVNDFRSTIKELHFKSLRAKFQIPDNIPLHLPYKLEKFYYEGVDGVEVYEQMLKARLGFPLSSLHCHLLQYLGLVITQISSNAWRVFLGVEVLYGVISDGARRLMVEEFFHCYRPT